MVKEPAILIAEFLEEVAQAHEIGSLEILHNVFNKTEQYLSDQPGNESMAIAYNFLDGWVDASNHDWQYYDGIEKEDWPILGRQISIALRQGKPVENEVVLKHFELRK